MKSVTRTIIAIATGIALVAGVWWISGGVSSAPATAGNLSPFRAEAQHIYGNPRAETTIVEFSDVECPFCARVHPTLERIVDESNGTINWEYRHLALPFHQNAEYGAILAECVAENIGNDAFWAFLQEVLANHAQLSTSYLNGVAERFGVSAEQVEACADDPELAARLINDAETAAALGGSGTPYSVIVFPDGLMRPVSGALPYEQWQTLLERS